MTTILDNETDKHEQEQKLFLRFFNKALIFQSKKQYEQAIEYYEKAASLKPDHLPTRQVLGYLYQALNQWAEALSHYRAAIDLHNHSATLQNSAGLCAERCKILPEAKAYYLRATELKQNNADALNNLGNICRKMGEYEAAEKYLLSALRLNISVETLANLGVMMSELGKQSQALSFYDHALRLQPDNPQINWNKGLILLSQGNFDRGWQLYDQGKVAKTRSKQISPPVKSKNEYSINYFKGKNVYIRGEQGIGDEIMFSSCIPDIIVVANNTTVECDERLLPLFQRSFPTAKVITEYDSLIEQPDADTEKTIFISSASLGRFTRRGFNTFPLRKAYLYPFEKAVTKWRDRYRKNNRQLQVGISWFGGLNEERRRRSTALKQWEPILQLDEINFINLQYGDISNDKFYVDKYLTEWPDTNHFHNIEELAAQIAALDLVITVSNVTAHLAGALGVPTYVLLPHSPNWRWFRGQNPCYWYSSVKLFKQEKPDEWDSVFEQVQLALEHSYLSKEDEEFDVSHDEV